MLLIEVVAGSFASPAEVCCHAVQPQLTIPLPYGYALQVMSERLAEHEDPQVRLQLKAFIDAL